MTDAFWRSGGSALRRSRRAFGAIAVCAVLAGCSPSGRENSMSIEDDGNRAPLVQTGEMPLNPRW